MAYQHKDAMVQLNAEELRQAAQAAGSAQQAALHAERGDAGALKDLQVEDGWLHRPPVVQGQGLQALQVSQGAQEPGCKVCLACKAQDDISQALRYEEEILLHSQLH